MFPTNYNVQNPGMQPQMQYLQMNQQMQQPVMQSPQMQAGKYKTQLCRHFKNGNCSLGASCHFAHGVAELRSFTDPLPNNLPQQPKVTGNNYKTVRCRYYDTGFCKNAASCNFAHGDADTKAGAQQPSLMPQQQNYDPNVQILIMILQNLEQVFPNDNNILQKLRSAQEFAKKSMTKEATQIILEIIESPERSPQEKQQYQTIYQNAQIYYAAVIQQQSQQK